MARTVVSGGGGYVGRFIVNHLIELGHEVTVLGRTRPPAELFIAPVAFHPMRLGEELPDDAALADADHFIHAAFDHAPGRYRGGEGDDPAGFRRRNIDGSNALFDMARSAGVSRALFLSSRAVYGTQPPGAPLTEETKPHPDTLYGEVKLAVERHLAALNASSLATASLRVTGVYGPAGPHREDKWTPLIRDWLSGRTISPRAGTEVHGTDVARAVEVLLDAPETAIGGRLFNVSDLVVDHGDVLAVAQQVTGCPHPLPACADETRLNVMETAKLRALGWMPGGRSLFRKTVRDLVERVVARA